MNLQLQNELNNFDLPIDHQPTPFTAEWLVEDMIEWSQKNNHNHDDMTGSGLEKFDQLTSFMNS